VQAPHRAISTARPTGTAGGSTDGSTGARCRPPRPGLRRVRATRRSRSPRSRSVSRGARAGATSCDLGGRGRRAGPTGTAGGQGRRAGPAGRAGGQGRRVDRRSLPATAALAPPSARDTPLAFAEIALRVARSPCRHHFVRSRRARPAGTASGHGRWARTTGTAGASTGALPATAARAPPSARDTPLAFAEIALRVARSPCRRHFVRSRRLRLTGAGDGSTGARCRPPRPGLRRVRATRRSRSPRSHSVSRGARAGATSCDLGGPADGHGRRARPAGAGVGRGRQAAGGVDRCASGLYSWRSCLKLQSTTLRRPPLSTPRPPP